MICYPNYSVLSLWSALNSGYHVFRLWFVVIPDYFIFSWNSMWLSRLSCLHKGLCCHTRLYQSSLSWTKTILPLQLARPIWHLYLSASLFHLYAKVHVAVTDYPIFPLRSVTDSVCLYSVVYSISSDYLVFALTSMLWSHTTVLYPSLHWSLYHILRLSHGLCHYPKLYLF